MEEGVAQYLTDTEIEEIYNTIKEHHERYLKFHGVKLPRLRRSGKFTVDALVLVYLARGYPQTRWVTKAELTNFVRFHYPNVPDVQSGRHLGMQKGFYILSSKRGNAREEGEEPPPDSYKLKTLENPHPSFAPKRRVQDKDEDIDFEKIKEKFGYRCATCGSQEGQPHLRYPKVQTKLQKGHMNPNEPPTPDNIIPQCEQCNRADKGRWVYDKRGRVVGVAKVEAVIQSVKKGYIKGEEVRKLYEFLRQKVEPKGDVG